MNRDVTHHGTGHPATRDPARFDGDVADRDVRGRRSSRRRAALVVAVATVTALAVAVPTVLAHGARTGAEPGRALTAGAGRARSGSPVLPGGTWTALPTAPIAARSDGVGVWTGTRLLVWGGTSASGGRDYADGATYDPARRTWAVLPPSPLSARAEMASVWTGHALYVWGGTNARGTALHDGAVYNPARRRWTTLRAAPITSAGSVQAFWTGSRFVLLMGPTGNSSTHLDLEAYNPVPGTWTVLPRLRLPARRPARDFSAVRAGDRLYVWSEWSRATKVSGGYEGTSGIDSYRFDLSRERWSPAAFTPRAHDTVTGPLWNGREILLPASQLWCGLCPGPFQFDSTGSQLDPRTGHARPIPHGPADDQNGQYLWTGSVLLAVNTEMSMSGGPGGAVYPGVAAYWQPSTDRWTRLPQAPLAGDAISVWTGHALLVWGELSPIHEAEGTVHISTTGLQFGR